MNDRILHSNNNFMNLVDYIIEYKHPTIYPESNTLPKADSEKIIELRNNGKIGTYEKSYYKSSTDIFAILCHNYLTLKYYGIITCASFKEFVELYKPMNYSSHTADIYCVHYDKDDNGEFYIRNRYTKCLDGGKHGKSYTRIKPPAGLLYIVDFELIETYDNGILHGLSIKEDFHNKITIISNYNKSILDGLYSEKYDKYDETPKIICNYKNGLLHGRHVEYYENGKVKRIQKFRNGKKTGKYKVFYHNGKLQCEYNIIDGKIIGDKKLYYKNGNLKNIREYDGFGVLRKSRDFIKFGNYHSKYCTYDENGKLHGNYQENYKNGYIKIKCNYEHGKLNGNYIERDNQGYTIKKLNYIDDKIWGKGYISHLGNLYFADNRVTMLLIDKLIINLFPKNYKKIFDKIQSFGRKAVDTLMAEYTHKAEMEIDFYPKEK